jgi:hypothetical protein
VRRSAKADSVAPVTQKLDVPTVLQRVWETYRDQFALLVQAALIVFVPIAILNGLILTGGGIGLALIAGAIGIIGTFWFQGMVVEAARDMLDGRRDHTVGSLFSSVTPVVGPLIGAGILAGIAIGIGFILIIVPGLFLLTIWAVLAPVIVIERAGIFDAFGRSRALVRGHGWQVFGVIVVLFLLQIVLGAIVQTLLLAISDSFVGYTIADLIVRVLVGPLSALAAAIMYFELKRLHGEAVLGQEAVTAPAPSSPAVPTQPAAGAPSPQPGPEAPPGTQPGAGAPPRSP